MAMRAVARRWPGASQARAMLRSGRQQQEPSRTYSSGEPTYTGKGFDEKEKAAETRFIKQREEELKLKKAAGETNTHPAGESPVSTPNKAAGGAVSEGGGFLNTAVVAGIVAAVAGYWLLSGSGSSKKEEKDST